MEGIFNSDLIDLTLVIISIIVLVFSTKSALFKAGKEIFQLLEIRDLSSLLIFFHNSSVIKGINGCNLIKIKFKEIDVTYFISSNSSWLGSLK